MKRILFLLIALAVAAFGGWYYWQFSQRLASASVAALLPRETIFVAQIPDFNRARDEWQHCDIYQLYREPAVQDFLRKPLGNVPKTNAASQILLDIEQLAPENAFVALTSIENNNPKIAGGFHFRLGIRSGGTTRRARRSGRPGPHGWAPGVDQPRRVRAHPAGRTWSGQGDRR